jgi:hypothetical protein
MMNLVYQGGRELLQHDASLLGIEMRSEETILMELATKAGRETANLFKTVLEVKRGKRVLDTVHIADEVKKQVLKEAESSKKLNAEEIKVLKEGVRSSVDTGYGTFHEDEALDMYEQQCGWEVRERNAAIMAWPFCKAEDVTSDSQVEQPTVVPISKATPTWKSTEANVNKEPKLNGAVAIPETAGVEGTVDEASQAISTKEQDNPIGAIDGVETSEKQSCHEAGMNENSGDELSPAQQQCKTGNHHYGEKRPFFTIFGSVDGIRDELWCPPCAEGVKEASIFDEEWSLRQIIVECKHRMKKSYHAPPLYDQIQTTAYCLMYNVNDADIVQVVRNSKPRNVHKKVKAQALKCEHESSSGHDAPETVAAELASIKAESKAKEDLAAPKTDATDLASAKAGNQSSSDLAASETNAEALTSTKNVTGASSVPPDVGNKENEKETSIGRGSVDKKPIIEQIQGESQVGDNFATKTNDVSPTGGAVAVTPKEQQTDCNETISSATVEIDVKRVSLDDPIMQHGRNWHEVVQPRLRSFVEAVYRVRADDDKRYRLLSGMSDPLGNLEAWNVLHEECPWLKDCDTAFLRDTT